MAHNNPTKPPTEEQKIDWLLDSVTEKTYDSVHSTCTDKLLFVGDLTFAKVLKLTTPPPFAVPATKAPRAKIVLPSVEDVEAQDTLATLPPASRLDHATIVPKAKAIPTAHTTKAKARTTLPPATLTIANPN